MDELLVTAAAPEVHAERLADLAARADWPATAARAEAHRLAPLLYWRLKQACPGAVPPAALAGLEHAYRGCVAGSLAKVAELRRVLAALDGEGIAAIAFKGPTLSVMAYGVLGPRIFGDLDIFVAPSEVRRAVDALLARGYAYVFGPEVMRAAGAIEVDLDNGVCALDLHWHFTPKYFARFEPDYARVQRVPLAGFEAPSLCAEDLLVYLAADYGRDCWQSLSSIADVAHLVWRRRLDWDEVAGRAERLRLRRLVLLALAVASGVLGAPVPKEMLKRWGRDPVVGALASRVRRELSRGGFRPEGLGSAVFHLRSLDTGVQRVGYCVRRAFEPNQKDLGFVSLPARARSLYFLVRPLRLALMGATFGRLRY